MRLRRRLVVVVVGGGGVLDIQTGRIQTCSFRDLDRWIECIFLPASNFGFLVSSNRYPGSNDQGIPELDLTCL